MKRFHILLSGRVQGVGFRYFAKDCAEQLKLTGWVRNLPDGKVEAEVQGQEAELLDLLSKLRRGPRVGFVKEMLKYEIPLDAESVNFIIRY